MNDSKDSDLLGGATNFLQKKHQAGPSPILNNNNNKTPEMDECLNETNYITLQSVKPRTGAALIFRHEMLHEGAKVLRGFKYIVKTEIIFRAIHCHVRYSKYSFPDSFQLAQHIHQLYENSDSGHDQYLQSKISNLIQKEDLQVQNNFVETYLQAVRLQQKYCEDPPFPQLQSSSTSSGLSVELIEKILTFLDVRDILHCVIYLSKALPYIS